MSESALTQPQRFLQAAFGLDPSVMVSTPDYVSQYTQLPEHWEYDINPGSGNSRATYLGEVYCGGQAAGNRVATQADIAAATTGVSSFNTRTGAVTLQGSDISAAGGALLASPSFSGVPLVPTAAPNTNTGQIASTAFVTAAISGIPGVMSWNGRTGNVALTLADVTAVGGAPLASPNLSGVPTGPTASPGTNTQQLATCSFVINTLGNTVVTWNGRVGNVTMTLSDVTSVGGAPINAPAFTGVATGVTATPGTSTTQLATTAFVTNAVQAATVGVSSFNTRTGAVTLQAADISGAGGALLAGPALTGVPTAPTAPANTNTTQIATCAFVETAVAGASVVTSFNSRTGAVTLSAGDVSGVGALMTSGGTMTGTLTLSGNASTALAAVPYQQLQTYLPLAGGTLTGNLILNGNATLALQAVPYQQLTSYTAATYVPLASNSNITASLGIGVTPPAAATVPNLFANNVTLPLSSSGVLRFNAYAASASQANYLANGYAASIYLDASGNLGFATYASGTAGNPATSTAASFWLDATNTIHVNQINGTGANFSGSCNAGPSTIGGVQMSGTNISVPGTGAIGGVLFNGSQNVWPSSNNASSCGFPGFAWAQVCSYAFAQQSDPRLKKDMAPAPAGALPKILGIGIHNFRWNEEADDAPLHTGFDASEIQAEMPGAPVVSVGNDPNKTLSINTAELVAWLWQAVQELSAQVTTLQARLPAT